MAPKVAEEQKAGKSKAEKKPVVKKAEKKIKADTKGEGKKKRTKKSVETYKIYIYKVLKQVNSWDSSVVRCLVEWCGGGLLGCGGGGRV